MKPEQEPKLQAVVTERDKWLRDCIRRCPASETVDLIASYRVEIEAQAKREIEAAEMKFGRYVAACPCKCHNSAPHNSCADCVREAKRERDFEWWQALCLVDAVAPEPEAVKRFVVGLHDEAKREGALEALEAAMAEIRAKCSACEGSGYADYREDESGTECEYCGRPRDAIRALAAEPEVSTASVFGGAADRQDDEFAASEPEVKP